MNIVVTSKEKILEASRFLTASQGFHQISIRSVASYCGISIGSVYNYFPSKSALMMATVESIWQEIFGNIARETPPPDICHLVNWLYDCMAYGRAHYPGFMENHPLAFTDKEKKYGLLIMEKILDHIQKKICLSLKTDPRIRKDAFNDQFTPEAFSQMLFSLVLSTSERDADGKKMVLEIVRRTLY